MKADGATSVILNLDIAVIGERQCGLGTSGGHRSLRPSTLAGLRETEPTMPRTAHVTLSEATSKGPPPPGNLAVPIFAHGTLEVEMYTPAGTDRQKPHDRDEIYVVARGTGTFFDGITGQEVRPGSFIFVAAGQSHRFESFTSDFAVRVFFYGATGGEKADQPASQLAERHDR